MFDHALLGPHIENSGPLNAARAIAGFASGVSSQDVISYFEDGVGSTLMEVGLLIALDAMLGKLLAESGGADRVANTLVDRAGPRLLPLDGRR